MLRHPLFLLVLAAPAAAQVTTVPNEVQMPGTQPGEVTLQNASYCANCHSNYDPAVEPTRNWQGSMMANASRDPLFWAAAAVAEQDFPGGADLCIRCHTPKGWVEGRSTPTDGSALVQDDVQSVACDVCHSLTNPDDSEHLGVQNPPFYANDEQMPPTGYYGSAQLVLFGTGEKLGPYSDATSPHTSYQSLFHRSPDLCGSCHDVSNPVVGDLAPGNGAYTPLAMGTFDGTLGGTLQNKAAFNNFPYQYGMVERTYSEHKASGLDTLRISAYGTLPADLQAGAIERARDAAVAAAPNGDYADGAPRYFTCQSCHVRPVQGVGCAFGLGPMRDDLPLHDLTGANYWVPDAIEYLDAQDALVLGDDLDPAEYEALFAGQQRALDNLRLAASLEVIGDSVRVVNLTGHKLITGYPEGRRMWLRIKWFDRFANVLRIDGEYGPITATVNGMPTEVMTILDLSGTNTKIYETKMGMTQEWAAKLVNTLGYSTSFPLSYDRVTGAVATTLGDLMAMPAGSKAESFHFVLNDTSLKDNRIPPYGMSYDEAVARNAQPNPPSQYGSPTTGQTYDYRDDVALNPPAGAFAARIDLLYQTTSWEYIQFLSLANDGSITHLASTGDDILDAWLNTGMAKPVVMASAIWSAPERPGNVWQRSGVDGSVTLER